MVYGNVEKFKDVTRVDGVTAGYKGTTVRYVVPANRYFSDISQADADAKADADITANAQKFADTHGDIEASIFYNARLEMWFKRDNCELDMGSDVLYVVKEGTYISYISQEDADKKAKDEAMAKGQKYANQNGKCCTVYLSKKMSGIFHKDDCAEGTKDKDGSLYTLPEGTFINDISQTSVDEQAMEEFLLRGQAYANEHSTCVKVYYNTKMSGRFQKKCQDGYEAPIKRYAIEAGRVYSFVSQADADEKGEKLLEEEGNAYARANSSCVLKQ